MRNRFDRELELLNTDLIEMGGLIESAIDQAVNALFERGSDMAYAAMEYDTEVDHMEQTIETRCLRLLLQQQPVAKDLRVVSAALKMITDMERIGDQSSDIAEISLRLPPSIDFHRLEHIRAMAKAASKMVTEAINAFVQRDLALAQSISDKDDEVDQLFEEVRDDLIEIVRHESEDVAAAIDLLMIAKYFERIGDHAVNISEWVVYSITGEHQSDEAIKKHDKHR